MRIIVGITDDNRDKVVAKLKRLNFTMCESAERGATSLLIFEGSTHAEYNAMNLLETVKYNRRNYRTATVVTSASFLQVGFS